MSFIYVGLLACIRVMKSVLTPCQLVIKAHSDPCSLAFTQPCVLAWKSLVEVLLLCLQAPEGVVSSKADHGTP